MIDESKELAAADAASAPRVAFNDSDQPLKDEPIAEEITIDDFAKVDLRVARVIAAEHVPGSQQTAEVDAQPGR